MIQNILYLTIFQIISFSLLSFCRKNNGLADKTIGLWEIMLGLQVTCISLSTFFESENQQEVISFLGLLISTLHGAFLLLYTKYVTNTGVPQIKSLRYNVVIVLLLFVLVLESPEQIENLIIPVRIFSLLVNFVYIIKSFFVLIRYREYVEHNFSSLEKLSISWLRSVIGGIALFGLGALVCFIVSSVTHVIIPLKSLYAVLVFLFISILFYKRIFLQDVIVRHKIKEYNDKKVQLQLEQNKFLEAEHNKAISSNPIQMNDNKENENDTNLYNYSCLDNSKMIEIADQLKICMEEKMLYKNMNLTLKDLAKEINVYPHYLTQTLNTVMGHNFYDFVNYYRVEEAKCQLLKLENENLTILAIGYESGFNSKSSFNRIFKMKTGMSPSAYKKQQIQNM